ncbi:UNVERIFIED_CONTAM: Retrovirus-related Pol polyprotein from transposon RE1 [Sesamum calycinum]|uniref:Retrovirus-related Pol polyprotein from transposon RE1 n=1 Tax=Sesamum calycinum TaxID=2727403 RepID=A0AAW2K0X0_9LAMI
MLDMSLHPSQAANASIKIDVPVRQAKIANEPKTRLKRGRSIGSKDKNFQKRKGVISQDCQIEDTTLEESLGINNASVPEETQEYRQRNNWPKWKDTIEAELNSLAQRKVFGPVVLTPEDVKSVGYKWVFVRKRNEQGKIVRYKTRLVAQGFSQRPSIDYEETYSFIVDATTFGLVGSFLVFWATEYSFIAEEDEEQGIIVPTRLWEANVDSLNLCLVGRLLSYKPYRFEALSSSLQNMLLPVKGMEVKQLQEGRFLLRFKHIIDKQHALQGCLWGFDKNILILKSIGVFRDMESDDTGCSWGASIRIRVSLNVNHPLKRALKIRALTGRSLQGGDELKVIRYGSNPRPVVLVYLYSRVAQEQRFLEYSKAKPTVHILEPNEKAVFVTGGRGAIGYRARGWPPLDSSHLEGAHLAPSTWLGFLFETKCKARRCDRMKNLVNYNGVGVEPVGKGGGLLLLWRKDLDVWLQSFSSHHIDVTVKSEDCLERWRFMGFYGYPEVGNRKEG